MAHRLDFEEQEAIRELKAMSREELDNVQFTMKKWVCQCKGCNRGTKVRDYGISPEFYWPRKVGEWVDLNKNYFLCGKHWPFMKRMEKLYDRHAVEAKLLEFPIDPLKKMIDIKFEQSNKLNE